MLIEVSQSSVLDVYQMLVGLVTPRPIAWVTTMSKTGIVNLAPFSFFNVFGANPPVVVFSPTLKRDGTKKDTLLHIEATREFVINASTEQHAEKVNQSSASLPPEESEVALIGMETVPSIHVRPPRLLGVPFALECRLLELYSGFISRKCSYSTLLEWSSKDYWSNKLYRSCVSKHSNNTHLQVRRKCITME